MIKSKFRIVYQDNSYTIEKGFTFLRIFVIWKTVSHHFPQFPDDEFGYAGPKLPYKFSTMREAMKCMRRLQKGES